MIHAYRNMKPVFARKSVSRRIAISIVRWSDAPFWQSHRGASAAVFTSCECGHEGEAESRRKVDDGDDAACA